MIGNCRPGIVFINSTNPDTRVLRQLCAISLRRGQTEEAYVGKCGKHSQNISSRPMATECTPESTRLEVNHRQ